MCCVLREWQALLSASEVTSNHILAPTTLDLAFYQCIQQDNPMYARGKFEGSLPSLHVYVSDRTYTQLMELVAAVAPPATSDEADGGSSVPPPSDSAAAGSGQASLQGRSASPGKTAQPKRRTRSGSRRPRSRAASASRAKSPVHAGSFDDDSTAYDSGQNAADSDDEFFSCDEGSESMMDSHEPQPQPEVSEEELALTMAKHVAIQGTFAIEQVQVTILQTTGAAAVQAQARASSCRASTR